MMSRTTKNELLSAMMASPEFGSRESVYVRWYPKSLTSPHQASLLEEMQPRPSGAYLHVPFCERLCRFCPFNKRPVDAELLESFVDNLLREIRVYGEIARSSGLRYLYFGGGTPSVLSPRQVGLIVDEISHRLGFAQYPEITLESHPTHVDKRFLLEMQNAGVTRFSSGIQSFNTRLLQRMGAQHAAEDSERCLRVAADSGVYIAADLLFRCPDQSVDEWLSDVQHAANLGVKHLSCYSLVLKSSREQPPPEVEAEMTVGMHELLTAAGYYHYGSCASGGFDYAIPGHECVYEHRHWAAPQDEYIGFGPGAFGFLDGRTTVNGLGLQGYGLATQRGRLPLVSATKATEEELKRRFFVLGVKTLKVDFGGYRMRFMDDPLETFSDELRRLQLLGFADVTTDSLVLSALGRLYVDSISAIFFSANERSVTHPEEPEIRRMEVMVGSAVE